MFKSNNPFSEKLDSTPTNYIYFFSSDSSVLAFVFLSLLLSIHWGATVMNTLRSLSIYYFGNTFCSPSVFLIKFIDLYYLA